MTIVEVLIAVAATRVNESPLAPRLSTLSGKRIGCLDNMQANAGAAARRTNAFPAWGILRVAQ